MGNLDRLWYRSDLKWLDVGIISLRADPDVIQP